MKLKSSYLAIAASLLILAGCGGGPTLGDKSASRDDLVPVPVDPSQTDVARPDPNLPVITSQNGVIYDVNKKPILMRGITLQYGEATAEQLDGVTAISATGSNVVRLLINPSTTDIQLEKALVKSIEKGLVSIVTLSDSSLRCSEDITKMNDAVNNLWLKKWLTILAEDRFQASLMINIADGWGPKGTYFGDYKAEYETYIKRFRKAGFKVPLVIDAPDCGQNFRGFMLQRGEAFRTIDTEHNVILSVQADGSSWNTPAKAAYATSQMDETGIAYIVSSMAGSGVGNAALDHIDLMKKATGDHALQLNLPWLTTGDAAAYSVALEKPTNLKGGAVVSVNTYMDSDYLELVRAGDRTTPTGKTKISLYIKDVNGNRLNLASDLASNMRAKTWNTITAVAPADNDQINSADLLQGATSFDLANVTEVGVQVLANGKPATVKGKIKFDDIQVYEGVPPVLVANFDSTLEGWSAENAASTNVDGSWAINPQGGNVTISLDSTRSSLDFSKPLQMKMRVYVPSDYQSDINSAYIQLFAQFGPDWAWNATNIPSSNFKAGQWNDVSFSIPFTSVNSSIIKTVQAFGIQLGAMSAGKSGPILIDSIVISDPSAKKLKAVTASQHKYSFLDNEGFVGLSENGTDWIGAAKVTVVGANGELSITPQAGTGNSTVLESRDIHNINEINLAGPLTIKAKVFIPASYNGAGLKTHIFMMDGEDWTWFQTSDQPLDTSKLDQWSDLEIVIPSFPSDFNTKLVPNDFGIIIDGIDGLNGGTIKLKDLEFIGTTFIDDSTPALSVGFANQTDLAAFKFDFSAGAFTESALVNATSWDYKIKPFGWTAASWRGNVGAAAPLDISISENVTDPKNVSFVLTERGAEIVLGENGIVATSILATFPPAPAK